MLIFLNNLDMGGGQRNAPPACTAFPVTVRHVEAALQTDAESPAIIADYRPMELRPVREADLPYALLNANEQIALLNAWDGGEGMFTPFIFLVPGDTTARRWVFAGDEFSLSIGAASNAGECTIRLMEASEP